MHFIVKSYETLGDMNKVAQKHKCSITTVRNYLIRYNAYKPKIMEGYNKKEIKFLKDYYIFYKSRGRLQDLAKKLGRTYNSITQKAFHLGLTRKRRVDYEGKEY
jgi:hypothetical protein